MNPPAIVVPFKGEGHKSRLSPALGPADRKEVAYLLLASTLDAVRRAGMASRCFVVSSDFKAGRIARQRGIRFIHEPNAAGVNSAVRLAVRRLSRRERFMVIPSDLPLLSAGDLEEAEELGEAMRLVIAPSISFNGTNLLLFRRGFTPHLSYDRDSFWNHLDSAARLGLATAVLTSGGVVFDLDTPSDLGRLTRLDAGTRVAAYIRKSLAK